MNLFSINVGNLLNIVFLYPNFKKKRKLWFNVNRKPDFQNRLQCDILNISIIHNSKIMFPCRVLLSMIFNQRVMYPLYHVEIVSISFFALYGCAFVVQIYLR